MSECQCENCGDPPNCPGHDLRSAAIISAALSIVILVDAFAVWLAWNMFVAHVTDMPEISYLAALSLGLAKSVVIRGFGLRR